MKSKKISVVILCLLCALCLCAVGCANGNGDGKNNGKNDPPERSVFTVTFDVDGGEPIEAIKWTEGSAISLPTPTRYGYRFTGWFFDKAHNNPAVSQDFSVDKDVTLYAAWEYIPKTFTLSFVTNGEPLDAIEWTEGGAVSLPTPTRSEYSFAGWYYDVELLHEVDVPNFSVDKDSVLYAAWDYAPTQYSVRLYTDENEYTSVKYASGETVDISEWDTPEPIVFEGDGCSFLYWIDETYTDILEDDFVMPEGSLAFYAVYDMPQKYHWSYDADAHTYTSTGAGVRPLKNVKAAYYGELSVDFTVNEPATTGIGIIWNADIAESDYPYDYSTGSSYWYFHLNPNAASGGFQLSKVVDSYSALQTVSLANSPTAWKTKFDSYKQTGAPLSFNMKARFMPDKTEVFIDDELVYSYEGDELNTVFGSVVGLRTNRAGNVAKNAVWTPSETFASVKTLHYITGKDGISVAPRLWATAADPFLPEITQAGWESVGWYADPELTIPADKNSVVINGDSASVYAAWQAVTLRNGYKIYDDKYVYNTSGISVVAVDGERHEYGKWSATFTATSTTVGRIGLIFQANIASTDGALPWGAQSLGYLLYFNFGANKTAYPTNFTASRLTGENGAYSAVGAYTSKTVLESKGNGYGALTAFFNRVSAFFNGETQSVSVRLGIAITPTRIALYADDVLLTAYKNPGKIDGAGNQMGFFTEGNGEFSDWLYEEAEDANGFIITTDGDKKTYTSASVNATARHVVPVVGISGRYGKWEANVAITDTRSVGSGLITNTDLQLTAGAEQVLHTSAYNAYYLYHNNSANANFTLASYVNGKYTTGGTVKKYDASTAGALGQYHARNVAFMNGETSRLSVHMAIEVSPSGIKVYIDGELIIENASYTFAGVDACLYVGFNAYGCGATFTDFVFTPIEAQ